MVLIYDGLQKEIHAASKARESNSFIYAIDGNIHMENSKKCVPNQKCVVERPNCIFILATLVRNRIWYRVRRSDLRFFPLPFETVKSYKSHK